MPAYVWVAAIVAVLSWPVGRFQPPTAILDPSWQAGLHMGIRHGLDFGEEVAFTYGPLGFLAVPILYYPATFAVALAAVAAAHLAVVATVARELSRAFGLLGTVVLTYVFASVAFPSPEVVVALVAIVCARAGLSEQGELGTGMVAGLAILAALVTLVKFGSGLVALAVLGVTVVVPLLRREERRRRLLRAGLVPLVYVLSLLCLWLLAGQPLDALPPFLDRSIDIVTGYADAMLLEGRGRRWEYLAALLSAGLLALLIVRVTRTLPLVSRLLVGGAFAVILLAGFRLGFTRHDGSHALLFFAPVAIAMTALATREQRKLWAVAAIPLIVSASAIGGPRFLVVVAAPNTVINTLGVLVSGERREEIQREGRRSLRAEYPLSDQTVERLRGRTVHVDPWEAQVVWAHPELRWRPAPLFQSYIAYTAELDDANADFLASPDGPEIILHHDGEVDGRARRWESPRYVLQRLCRYRPVAVEPRFTVLERGRNRCGRPVEVSRRRVGFGQTVPVPRASGEEMVVARFEHIEEPLSQSLRALVFRPQGMVAWVGGGRVRFLRGHAGNPHVMRLPKCLGGKGGDVETQPFPSVRLDRSAPGSFAGPGQPLRGQTGEYSVRFLRLRFDCG